MTPGLIGIHTTDLKSKDQLYITLKQPERNLPRIISTNPVLIPISGRTKDGILNTMQKVRLNF